MGNNAALRAREKNGGALTSRWKLPFHLLTLSDQNPRIQFGVLFGAGAQGRERQMREAHR